MTAYKGKFTPKNPQKYKGDWHNITYRSGWECRIMNNMDLNPNVIEWSSEEVVIPYLSPVDKKWHRYFPDFLVRMNHNGKIITLLIEVKPAKQSRPPSKRSRVTKKYITEVTTWAVNQAKWKAAIEFCKDRKWEFKVMASDDGIKYEYLGEDRLMLS